MLQQIKGKVVFYVYFIKKIVNLFLVSILIIGSLSANFVVEAEATNKILGENTQVERLQNRAVGDTISETFLDANLAQAVAKLITE